MNTTNANVPTVARRLLLPWVAILVGLAIGFASGLFTGKSFSHASAPQPAVAAKADRPVAAAAVEPYPIVPSPVIEPRPNFFYGTGDGNGTYSDRW
jgi:hypothetical protein